MAAPGASTAPLAPRRGRPVELTEPDAHLDHRESGRPPGVRGPRGERILTQHIRNLAQAAATEGATEAGFDDFWKAFMALVQRELHRRGLWDNPPRFLGIEGADRWSARALEELATDAYAFILDRLRALTKQLAVKDNVDGLIVLNVRHFLHERQKQYDPLGFRVFEILRTAVRRAVEEEELEVLSGSPDVENRTILAPGPSARQAGLAAPGEASPPAVAESEPVDFVGLARQWADDLLPDLVLARGKARELVVDALVERLGQVARVQCASGGRGDGFLFKELLDACKRAVRVRWRAIWAREQGETALEEGGDEGGCLPVPVPVLPPDDSYEKHQSFQKLVSAVTDSLDELDCGAAQREQLGALWRFLRTQAPEAEYDVLPSRRKLSELLGVPRYRLPQLYGLLAQVVETCRARRFRPRRPPEESGGGSGAVLRVEFPQASPASGRSSGAGREGPLKLGPPISGRKI